MKTAHTKSQGRPKHVRDRPQRQKCHRETIKKLVSLDLTRSMFPSAPSRCPKLAREGDMCGSSDTAETQASRASASSPAFCAPTDRKVPGGGRMYRLSSERPNMNHTYIYIVPAGEVAFCNMSWNTGRMQNCARLVAALWQIRVARSIG